MIPPTQNEATTHDQTMVPVSSDMTHFFLWILAFDHGLVTLHDPVHNQSLRSVNDSGIVAMLKSRSEGSGGDGKSQTKIQAQHLSSFQSLCMTLYCTPTPH